ncbi:Uncharacterised protein [Vibrio cholerae]|nr:Uncharacterised protein [Vibrio cholerae]CSI27091.1 Uncharacterised protein [Vibrio cholerae]CSI82240.1 Uncharacterised protein [Vibrio cholerae]
MIPIGAATAIEATTIYTVETIIGKIPCSSPVWV